MKNRLRNVGMLGISQTLRGWILAGLMGGAILPALAQAFPFAWYQVGNEPKVSFDGSTRTGEDQDFRFEIVTNDYKIMLNVLGEHDPWLGWGLSAANTTGGILHFAYGFTTAIMPIATANTVFASTSGSVTDTGVDGVTVNPTQSDSDGDGLREIATNWLHSTTRTANAGVDVGAPYSLLAGGKPGRSRYLDPDDDFKAGPLAVPSDAWTSLETRVEFDLSRRDIATLNGYFSIDPVPEPRTLLLLGSGLIGAALVGMRRRRFRF